MFKRRGALREARRATLGVPVLIPAGQSGEIELIVGYDELVELIPSRRRFRARPEDIDSVEPKKERLRNEFEDGVALVPSELEGFVLYDVKYRYRVDLPRGW